ncbi:MAG: matrixin family metalloprotease [Arsenophonus sp. NC-XBC3-MAG3]
MHKIEHVIGVGHSDVNHSIMFAYHNGATELSNDDILAIQNLYGIPYGKTSLVYMFDLTSLQLIFGYPKHILSLFSI